MKEAFEKIKEMLEERQNFYERRFAEMSGSSRDLEDWGSIKSYKDAIEIVNQVAEEHNQSLANNNQSLTNGWIPYSERLPDKRDWYLAVFKEGNSDFLLVPRVADYVGAITKGTTYEGWLIIDLEDDMNSYYRRLKCVAWQPLPAPFKEKEVETKQESTWKDAVMRTFLGTE